MQRVQALKFVRNSIIRAWIDKQIKSRNDAYDSRPTFETWMYSHDNCAIPVSFFDFLKTLPL